MDTNYYKKKISILSVRDYLSIIKLAKRLKEDESLKKENCIKIAVIGSSSLQYFVMVLRLYLMKYSIFSDIFEGTYDGINLAVFDEHSELYKFQPQIVIILTSYRDIHDMPELFSNNNVIDQFITYYGKYYQELWKRISKIKGCYVFQSNFVIPMERELGNLESNLYYSRQAIYSLLNIELIKRKLENVTIIDMEYIASLVGKSNWFDFKMYFANKLDYSLKYIGMVGEVFAQQVSALKGKIRKCLVLDLDNTLWGGIVADEGANGIRIAPNDPIGEAYRFFQQYLLNLKNRGVILTVISKNDHQLAREPFDKNENMILKYDDFSSFIANWNDKASNIDLIAEELNISTDSFVFFDDNPAERENVKMYHPEVWVVEVPENIAEYVAVLEGTHAFDWINVTREDISRGETYQKNVERKRLNSLYNDYHEYLVALKMKGKAVKLEEKDIPKFVQLINKSNQFNIRTQRYTEADIKNMVFDNKYCLISVSLEDRFNKFGIISCVILKKIHNRCFIDTWVMSCRVLKRDVEYLTFRRILECAKEWGCDNLIGEYIPSSKNGIVEKLFLDLGFERLEKTSIETFLYIYDINMPFQRTIEIKEVD